MKKFLSFLLIKWNVTILHWQGTFKVIFAAFCCNRFGPNLPASEHEAIGRVKVSPRIKFPLLPSLKQFVEGHNNQILPRRELKVTQGNDSLF